MSSGSYLQTTGILLRATVIQNKFLVMGKSFVVLRMFGFGVALLTE
jgi:hypothetical protein